MARRPKTRTFLEGEATRLGWIGDAYRIMATLRSSKFRVASHVDVSRQTMALDTLRSIAGAAIGILEEYERDTAPPPELDTSQTREHLRLLDGGRREG